MMSMTMRNLTTEERNALASVLLGTNESIEGGIRAIGIDPASVDLIDAEWMRDIQMCNGCFWWYPDRELDNLDGYCYDCGAYYAR
jgi:hypothetical protein